MVKSQVFKQLFFSLFAVCLLLMWAMPVTAQMHEDEKVIRLIADNILDETAYGFVSWQDRKVYDSTNDIPDDVMVRLQSKYMEWHYTNGVLNMAMIDLAEFLKEDKYFDFAAKHVEFGMDNYKFFEKRFKKYEGKIRHYRFPLGQLWTMQELDDCGAMGASMIDVYEKVKRKDYKTYIEDAAKHISKGQDRLEDGTLVRKFPHEMTLWADDLYMSVPFLARMGKLSGDKSYWDDAAHQIFKFTDYLWNENKELYYHLYYSDLKRNGVAHWGRCNGWVMMAQVHLLDVVPEDYPHRDALIKNLEKQILGIAKYQNEEGLWHQILDKNDSYTESSCTAMFSYCIARAVNAGWIDSRYGSIAVQGWDGLKNHKITLKGEVKDICIGTGIQDNMVFYYKRPARLNEKHGLGAALIAGMEVMKLKQKSRKN